MCQESGISHVAAVGKWIKSLAQNGHQNGHMLMRRPRSYRTESPGVTGFHRPVRSTTFLVMLPVNQRVAGSSPASGAMKNPVKSSVWRGFDFPAKRVCGRLHTVPHTVGLGIAAPAPGRSGKQALPAESEALWATISILTRPSSMMRIKRRSRGPRWARSFSCSRRTESRYLTQHSFRTQFFISRPMMKAIQRSKIFKLISGNICQRMRTRIATTREILSSGRRQLSLPPGDNYLCRSEAGG